MIKTLVIIGGRPQIIKAAPLLKNNLAKKEKIKFILVNTGQHYSKKLLKNFIEEFQIKPPDFELRCPKTNSIKQIAFIMLSLEKVIEDVKPDSAIIFGDMNSTLASALALKKKKIPIIHVEAGTRSRNLEMKEEINRIIADHLSSVLLAPDDEALKNLIKENIKQAKSKFPKVVDSGDIMLEALLNIKRKISINTKKTYSLLTIHRNENLNSKSKLKAIFKILSKHKNQIIFPIHPHTKKTFSELSIKIPKNIKEISPVGYNKIIELAESAQVIFTDSGGMQKEACWLGKPCVILRAETEKQSILLNKQAVLYSNYSDNFEFNLQEKISTKSTSAHIIKAIKNLKADNKSHL